VSPETLSGQVQGPGSDWWSMGCLIYYVYSRGGFLFTPEEYTHNGMLAIIQSKYINNELNHPIIDSMIKIGNYYQY
jgi:serine/threonine protein kinase